MSQDQRSGQQRYFLQGIIKTHKALGAGLGIVVFIVCLSGAVALFDSELHTWTNAQLSHTNTPASAEFSDWPLDKIAEQAIARHSGEGLLDIEVLIIGKANPWQKYLTSWTHTEHDEAWHIDQWHGQTGEHIAQQPDGVNHLLAEIHTDLWLPNPYGRYLVGFAGVVLMLMALGGIFAHRHWRREFHTLKHNRGERRLWGDLHKLVGLWALPFHMIIGFTGALIGLLGLLLLLIAFVAYQGDTQAAVDEIFGQDPKP
ncbi:MAG: PepSY domain-containing protein, partial [Cellvibrionaceae bacterium]|nr:PepSY domain-containing protein [Cellvibrionaceae bacterium]